MKYLALFLIIGCTCCTSTLRFEKKLKEFLLTPIKTNTQDITEEEANESTAKARQDNWNLWEDLW